MPKLTRRQLIILTLGGFLSYLLFGMFDSMRGATLSVLLTDLDLSYTAGGSVVMGQYAGYFAATLLVGILADRTGPKFTLVLAACSLIFGVAGYAASSGLLALIAFIFFIGIGLGSLELGGCNIIAAIYKEKKGRYLNILAAIAGCGAFVTPMIAGLFLDQGVSWRLIYRSGLLIAVPAAVYFVLLRWPASFRHAGNAKETSAPSPGSFREGATSARHPRRARSLAVLSMNLSNFAYMAAEIGTATWLVDFYCHVKHFSILEASTGLSLFYIGITLGRLCGSLFVDRAGHVRSILAASLLAAICILGGIAGPESLALLTSASGFCYSIIFPTSTAVISEISTGHTGRTLGIFLAFGGLGGMFGPWIVGIINDLAGLETGLAFNCLFCGAVFLLAAAAGRLQMGTGDF